MDNDDKIKTDLGTALHEGDQWLLQNGITTPITHNNIVLNLYMNFPQVEYVDYLMDPETKRIEVNLYLPTLKAIFCRRTKLAATAVSVLAEYLKDFSIRVTIKRYKKDVKSKAVTAENPQ